jgi:hypothetical protein
MEQEGVEEDEGLSASHILLNSSHDRWADTKYQERHPPLA